VESGKGGGGISTGGSALYQDAPNKGSVKNFEELLNKDQITKKEKTKTR